MSQTGGVKPLYEPHPSTPESGGGGPASGTPSSGGNGVSKTPTTGGTSPGGPNGGPNSDLLGDGALGLNGKGLGGGCLFEPFSPIADSAGDCPEFPLGATYSSEQVYAGDHYDSDGYQGFNWHQAAQPELIYDFEDPEPLPPGSEASFLAGTMEQGDKIYLVFSADGFLEFERVEDFSYTFRGVNGTVGVLEHVIVVDGPDYDVVHDRFGNEFTFFGADVSGAAKQFWKRQSPEEVVLYAGHETDISLAASLGYGADLAIDVMYDSDDRRSTFTYSTIGSSFNRLTNISIEVPAGGSSYTEIASVDYGYYGSGSSNGLEGDLKSITTERELSDSGVRSSETTYYRYYTDSTGDGHPHFIRMIVEPEGVRRYGLDNPSTDCDDASVSDSVLMPYAYAAFEYYPETIPTGGTFIDPENSMKVKKMTTASGCSCGTDGVHEFRYERNPAYTDTAAYDTEWATRTIVSTPSGLWNTYYFDEAKSPLSTVSTVGDPAAATEVWATLIERDSDGYITAIHSPENITNYTHGSTDPSATVAVSFTCSMTSGLVTTYKRFATGESGAPNAPSHYIKEVWHQEGCDSEADAYIDIAFGMSAQVETVGGAELTRVFISSVRPFEDEVTEASSSSSDLTTTYYHSFDPSTSVVLELVGMTSPTPTSGKNGAGSFSISSIYYRKDGSPIIAGHPDGTYDYYRFDRGNLVELIEDAYSSNITEMLPGGLTFGSTDSLQRTTKWAYDDNGRAIYRQEWDGRLRYLYHTKLADERIVSVDFPLVDATLSGTAPDPEATPSTFYGPAGFVVSNLAGQPEEIGTIAISSGSISNPQANLVDESESSALDAFALGVSSGMGDLGSLSRIVYNKGGWLVEESHAYFDIPSPGMGLGTEGTNYDATLYEYDASGNLVRVEDPTGTIRAYTYDEWIMLLTESMGTDDSGAGNMVVLKEYEYDNGNDGGNFNLTKVTLHEDGSTTHVTTIEHDYRGRALLVEAPEAPHLFAKLDNLGRTVAIGEYSDVSSITITSSDPMTTTTKRVGLREASYDEMGRVWRTKLHDIEQPSSGVSGGADLSSLESLYWYDSMSRLRKTTGQSYAKYSYDSLGRMTRSYLLGGDDDLSYSDALDVAGDVVVTEGQKVYQDVSDFLAFDFTIERYHDSGTSSPLGALDTNADGDSNVVADGDLLGRPSATGYTYDDYGRLATQTFAGVPDGTTFTSGFEWDALVPTNNPSVGLVQEVDYSDRGHAESVTDPMGRVKLREIDDLGRTTAVYNNYVDGVLDAINVATDPGGIGTAHWDDDQKVSYTYVDGLLTQIKAHDPSIDTNDPDQVTTYTYGSATSGSGPLSDVATGHYLTEIAYPDSASSTDIVSLAYNRFGQVTWQKDQAGNVIERDIDGLGRTAALRATTIATGFDARVKRIERGYDERGGLALVTQYGAATGGAILDQVAIDRFGHGGISSFDQDWDSAVGGGGSLATRGITYDYALSTGGRRSYRKTKQTLPSGREFSFTYAAGIDNALSRVSTLMDDRRRVTSYKYLGASRVVGTNYGVPDVHSNLFGSTSGDYPGLDEYGRVVSFQWTKKHSLGTTDFYDVSLTLDDNSNPTLILDNVVDDWDVSATHDELNRIASFEEGGWGGSSMSNVRSSQSWLYDQIGNWVGFDFDIDGDGAYTSSGDLNESRESNEVNEIEGRDLDSDGTADETLAYDAVGNLISTGNRTYTYDVWGRQTHVYLGGTGATTLIPFAEYEYNGLGYRSRELTDLDGSGELDGGDNWLSHVYDQDWRIVATYWGGDDPEDPKAEFLFHRAGFDGNGGSSYINSAVVRFRDANGGGWNSASDGVLEEEHYICASQRGDTIAVVDDAGETIEWARYSTYGVPFGLPAGDVDYNGSLTMADLALIDAQISSSSYSAVADVDLDGDVDSADRAHVLGLIISGDVAGGIGRLSSFGHTIGFAGMEYVGSFGYHARNRVFLADIGAWCGRDPLDYREGPQLYGYVDGRPIFYVDPMGLYGDKWDVFVEKMSEIPGALWSIPGKVKATFSDALNDPTRSDFEKGLIIGGTAASGVFLAPGAIALGLEGGAAALATGSQVAHKAVRMATLAGGSAAALGEKASRAVPATARVINYAAARVAQGWARMVRRGYDCSVRGIRGAADKMLAEGSSVKDVAGWAVSRRAAMQQQFRNLTPQRYQDLIAKHSNANYGSAHMTLESALEKHGTYLKVIEAACRPGSHPPPLIVK